MAADGRASERRDALGAVAALSEPNRRALYEYVVARRDWVSREQAAAAVGLGRSIASHHLDRLAEEGLLDIDFQRLNDRRGPGAGRPAKVYRRALSAEIVVSLPPAIMGWLAGFSRTLSCGRSMTVRRSNSRSIKPPEVRAGGSRSK